MWDLWALNWVQKKAECLRFCTGRSVTLTGQLPVSIDIEYEFSSRNPYNFLQVTYYKVSSIKGLVGDPYVFFTTHLHTFLSFSCYSLAGKVPEGSVSRSYVLHCEPQSPGDEE